MRLTNIHREAFVRAAMADVPLIDYHELMQNIAIDAAVAKLPPAIQALWNKPEMRGYLAETHVQRKPPHWIWLKVPGLLNEEVMLPDAVMAQIHEMEEKKDVQYRARVELERKLHAAIKGCTTRKAAAQALPEFEKYLPPETDALDRTVPALANIVKDFMNAGWPKEQRA